MPKRKTELPDSPKPTRIVVDGDTWTIVEGQPGLVFVRDEEEHDDIVLIDATRRLILTTEDASWHSIGHAIECAERISRRGRTFNDVEIV